MLTKRYWCKVHFRGEKLRDLTLGRVLGECLSNQDDLSYIHVPDGIPLNVAASIVLNANGARDSNGDKKTAWPFAFLVAEGPEDPNNTLCPRIAPQTTVRYRSKNRLAVVHGRQPELASFKNTFNEVLGQSYPLGASGPVSLKNLSEKCIRIISADFELPELTLKETNEAVGILERCLALLTEAYQAQVGGSRGWNANWFDHVSHGFMAMQAIIEELIHSAPDSTLVQVFQDYVFPSFGLPQPQLSGSNLNGASIVRALEDFWSSEEAITATIGYLAYHPETVGGAHPLEDVDFSGTDLLAASTDSLLAAFSRKVSEKSANVSSMSYLTEAQFLQPINLDSKDAFLRVRMVDGNSQTISRTSEEGPFFIPLADVLDGVMLSEELRIDIPTLTKLDPERPINSQISPEIGVASSFWDGYLEVNSDGALQAVGRFGVRVKSAQGPMKFGVKKVRLAVNPSDELSSIVASHLSCEAFVFPRSSTFLIYAPVLGKGKLGKFKYVGPANLLDSSNDQEYNKTLESGRAKFYISVWHAGELVTLNGIAMRRDQQLPDFRVFELDLTGTETIVAGERTFNLLSEEEKRGHQSALLAAAYKQHVTPVRPEAQSGPSIRGRFEEYIKDALYGDGLSTTLGHVILPEDVAAGLDDLGFTPDAAFLIPAYAQKPWANSNLCKVDYSFLHGIHATRFRAAFDDMHLADLMDKSEKDEETFRDWPSRTSWRSLWANNYALREYLDAYTALIDAARATGNAANVFWASYPMSISVWTTKYGSGCKSVLLSPLHPLRLAWLAGVELTLFEAEDAVELAGTVEGWNIPLIGPRETKSGRLVAVPTDSGENQVFLGWSMMVMASIDGYKSLASPQRAGNYVLPGSAVSGLNGAAAASALRSYKAMHPYLSTLTIDLAAGLKTSRLTELDESVLAAVEEWTSGRGSGLDGGARVKDSLSRQGNIPREQIAQLVRSNPDLLLTWSRYEPDAGQTEICNVRFLQDAGTKIEIQSGSGGFGALGPVPLRRFEGYAGPSSGNATSISQPAVANEDGWAPFVEALNAVEAGEGYPQIATQLFNTLLVDGRADWTVSGESLLSPSAIADLIKDSGPGNQMLWEWRPPYLEKNEGVALLERRPYMSVAKVPASFESQLDELLSKAHGKTVTPDNIRDLIGKLGGRGVGLSALLSMGGTHAAGAIGFYLAFSLLDKVNSEGADQFILPIDASDSFLSALSGGDKNARSNRRADLLIARIDEGEVVLVPVEVKCYGLKSGLPSSGNLPVAGMKALDESLQQLDATYQLLQNLAKESVEVSQRSQADGRLWMNGLATLLETGARLQPTSSGQPERLARRLGAVASGRTRIRVGRPLVTYFKYDSTTPEGNPFHVSHETRGSGENAYAYAVMAADIGHVFDEIEEESGSMLPEWREAVAWSLEVETSNSTSFDDHKDSVDVNTAISQGHNIADARKELAGPDDSYLGAHNDPKSGTLSEELSPERVVHDPLGLGNHKVEAGPSSAYISGDGVKLGVGKTIGSLAATDVNFWPSNTRLNQMNVGVVGDLGTGKTELLKALVAQLRHQAKTNQTEHLDFLILDYKGDFQDDDFLHQVGGSVLDPMNIPLNIFRDVTQEHATLPHRQAGAFVDILKRIYSGIGPVQNSNLTAVIRELFEENGGLPPTLSEVRDRYIAKVPKPDSVSSILDSFVFGQIFSDRKDELLPFNELIRGRVLIVAVNKLGTDKQAKNALVALFLNVYFDYMIKSVKLPFQGEEPQLRFLRSFLLVDEAVNIMSYEFPVLMEMMLLGRQFGFGTILGSQYLSHFKQSSNNYAEPLLTWFIHKVPAVSAAELVKLGMAGASSGVAERIPLLKQHEVLYKSLGSEHGRFIRVTPYYELYPKHPTGSAV